MRVLIIEDNQDAAEILREVLEMYEHEVAVAFSGPQGVEAARAFHPQVVLCDLGLPGMNGYEVATTLRQDPETCEARLVALTGYSQADERERARASGFEVHLTKPVGLDEIQQVLADMGERAA
ncbi:MAG: response regulator [Planctomycetes bacterium]|nr:response regulator [Planctomycetota bacterium]